MEFNRHIDLPSSIFSIRGTNENPEDMRARKRHADVPFSLKSRRDEIGRREIRGAIKEKRKEQGAQVVCTISFRDYITHSALVSGVGRSPMVVSVRVDQ